MHALLFTPDDREHICRVRDAVTGCPAVSQISLSCSVNAFIESIRSPLPDTVVAVLCMTAQDQLDRLRIARETIAHIPVVVVADDLQGGPLNGLYQLNPTIILDASAGEADLVCEILVRMKRNLESWMEKRNLSSNV